MLKRGQTTQDSPLEIIIVLMVMESYQITLQ